MASYKEKIGVQIKTYREELGYTQAEFAEKLDINRSSLSLIENGEQAPDFDTLAEFLRISGKDFFEVLDIKHQTHVVVDTNVILNRPNVLNDLPEYCDFIYIPKAVIGELNYRKDHSGSSIRKLAGLCMTMITKLKGESEKFIVGETVEDSKAKNNDDTIFSYAMDLAKKNKSDTVYLFSNDKDFKLKDPKKLKNLKVIESKEFDSVFRKTSYNIPRSQRFFDLVSRNDMQQLQVFCKQLAGVDVNYVDIETGYTPLLAAIRRRARNQAEKDQQKELIRFLLALPSMDVNRVDNKKYCFPPISHALQMHRTDIIELLLEHGANVNEPSMNDKNPYNTPLMVAAWGGELDEVKLLVENGACINQQDKGNGYTALIKSVYQNHPQVTKYLLEHGADASICSFERKTALDYAYEKNRQDIIKILKEGGAS